MQGTGCSNNPCLFLSPLHSFAGKLDRRPCHTASNRQAVLAPVLYFTSLIRLVAQKRRNVQVVYVALPIGYVLFFELGKA